MNSTQKALDIAQSLREGLNKRLAYLGTITGALGSPITTAEVAFDTDSCPIIVVGDGTNGHQGAFIKVAAVSWALAKDVLGSTAIQYGPHVIQFATESSTANSYDTPVNLPSVQLAILGEILARGTRVEWYQSANGVFPVTGTLITAKLAGTFEPNMQYPMVSNQ